MRVPFVPWGPSHGQHFTYWNNLSIIGLDFWSEALWVGLQLSTNRIVRFPSALGSTPSVKWALVLFLDSQLSYVRFSNNLWSFLISPNVAMISQSQECRSQKTMKYAPPPQLCWIVSKMVNKLWARNPIYLKNMSFWCFFIDPHLTTRKWNVHVQLKWIIEILMFTSKGL